MKTIAAQKLEFTTKFLKVSRSGKYFVGIQNGGSRGSCQPKDQVNGGWGFWHEPLHEIDAVLEENSEEFVHSSDTRPFFT